MTHFESCTWYIIMVLTNTDTKSFDIVCLEYNVLNYFFVVVALLFYVHGKHLRSSRDGQLT